LNKSNALVTKIKYTNVNVIFLGFAYGNYLLTKLT